MLTSGFVGHYAVFGLGNDGQRFVDLWLLDGVSEEATRFRIGIHIKDDGHYGRNYELRELNDFNGFHLIKNNVYFKPIIPFNFRTMIK